VRVTYLLRLQRIDLLINIGRFIRVMFFHGLRLDSITATAYRTGVFAVLNE